MATYAAKADGNWTDAATWAEVYTAVPRALVDGFATAGLNTGYSYNDSATYTFEPTVNVEIDGFATAFSGRALTPTGTVTYAIRNATDNNYVTGSEVTINISDIPYAGGGRTGWVFFKLPSAITLQANKRYQLAGKASSANIINYTYLTATGNFTKYFRMTGAVGSAPTTNDRLMVNGEVTAAGSTTSRSVTMDSTATTSYGQLDISSDGTVSFGTSASTNYYLRLAGNLNVFGNGTLNIGTSTTRIPSTSTATLEFSMTSAGQFHLFNRAGGTVNMYGAEKANTKVLLTADAASGQAVITVEDTTGWANGDELVVAPTTRTPSQGERRTISSIGSSTQATMTTNFTFAHQGTAPYQAGVINITRNVVVRGTSITLPTGIDQSGTFTAEYVRFQHVGANIAPPTLGLCVNAPTTVRFCAFVDPGANGAAVAIIASTIAAEDCVFTSTAAFSAFHGFNSGTTINRQHSVKRNWQVGNGLGSFLNTSENSGEWEDNRVAGVVTGFQTTTLKNNPFGVFKNNTVHSSTNGMVLGASVNSPGVIENFTAWRCATVGIINVSTGVTFANANLYHNVTNANLSTPTVFTDSVFDGGTGQSLTATTTHIIDNGSQIYFENCDFGQTNQATNFINAGGTSQYNVTFTNCDIAESLTPLNQTNIVQVVPTSISAIKFDKLNSTSGNHRAYKRFGYAGSDQSVYRTASPSEVLVPNSASGKLPSGSKKFGVASGNDATVSVWVRKSSTYNGAEPRLILKRNIVGGVSSDQVLDTASGATETWLELTASTPTVTDDCVLEVYVDCDGTAGTVNVDDYSIS